MTVDTTMTGAGCFVNYETSCMLEQLCQRGLQSRQYDHQHHVHHVGVLQRHLLAAGASNLHLFRVEPSYGGCYDKFVFPGAVTLSDGRSLHGVHACGEHNPQTSSMHGSITTQIAWYSDNTEQRDGWKFCLADETLEALPPPPPPPLPPCGPVYQQYAQTAVASSEYCFYWDDYCADDATGAPSYADGTCRPANMPNSWAPKYRDTTQHTLTFGFAKALYVTALRVWEAANPSSGTGFIQRVEMQEPTGQWHTYWESASGDTDTTDCGYVFLRELSTTYPVSTVRLTTQTTDDAWEYVDAVRLDGTSCGPSPLLPPPSPPSPPLPSPPPPLPPPPARPCRSRRRPDRRPPTHRRHLLRRHRHCPRHLRCRRHPPRRRRRFPRPPHRRSRAAPFEPNMQCGEAVRALRHRHLVPLHRRGTGAKPEDVRRAARGG